MKTQLLLRAGLAVVCLTYMQALRSQDIHFSQFYNLPLTLNPALTGVSAGDIRFTGALRSQWNAANAPYKTANVALEKKFYNITHDNWWLSGGVHIFHDKAGDGNLALTNLALSASYTRLLDKENFLTLGLSAGVGQRRFELGNLTFDNQWNGDIFDPNRPINEDFDDTNRQFPDFGIGINWRGQKDKSSPKPRSKMDAGVGAFHFNRPNQSYLDVSGKSQLPLRLSLYFIPVVQINEKVDLVGHGMAQIQGAYLEALAGAGGRLWLSTKKAKEIALQLAFTYRFNAIGDAIIPAAELHYRDLMVGLSWDVNVSGFSVATNRNGGPELTLRYIIYKVYPYKEFKACPLI